MICQICFKGINVDKKCTKKVSCSICLQSFHLNCVNNSDNRNSHDDQTDETSWYCAKCLSLPFSNLVDPDFYKEINSNGNSQINDLTLLTKANDSKSSPFSFSDNCDEDDIDPDNYLIRQTSNNNRCYYYTEKSFNHLLKDKKIKNELTLFHLNVRSLKNKFDDFCTYLVSLKINFSLIGISETGITDNSTILYDISGHKFLNVNRKNKIGGGVY